MSAARSYRLFHVTLKRKTILSPHMARLTFGGPAVREMRTCAADQRIKVFFPDPQGRPAALADRPDWYALYKTQDPAERPAMRTYTIRALRADELDIDFVLHGETGPASRWATQAQPGDSVQINAPNAAYEGEPGGFEWKPPANPEHVLLIADETALPAVAGILEALAAKAKPPSVQAFVEIPDAADAIEVATWPGLSLEWLPRGSSEHGDQMVEAARRAKLPAMAGPTPAALAEVDIEAQLPWDRATQAADGFYGWVAGESAAVIAIRKLLIQDRGVDRSALNLMGYWRLGRAID